jgi:hypothetical protein
MAVGTWYYLELTVDGASASATFSTGTYASAGGTVVRTVSTSSLAGSQTTGSAIKLILGSETATPAPQIDEVFIDVD